MSKPLSTSGRALMTTTLGAVAVWLLPAIFPACKRPVAQWPSNKTTVVDSTALWLQTYNRLLANEEDSLLLEYATRQPEPYKKSATGFWFHIEPTGEGKPAAVSGNDSVVFVSYQILDLAGNRLETASERRIRLGKKEVPAGLEEAIKMARSGQSARFIVPSYLMYGTHGTAHIPPQTPLLIVIGAPE